ncbi:hypothetical protein ACP275_04G161200 [Erythranthe tilingii]
MCCLTYRIIIFVLLICFGFLSIGTERVSASRSFRILNEDALQSTKVPLNIAPSPAMNFDPNQSEKRTVHGGSDPIHNRC